MFLCLNKKQAYALLFAVLVVKVGDAVSGGSTGNCAARCTCPTGAIVPAVVACNIYLYPSERPCGAARFLPAPHIGSCLCCVGGVGW